MGTHFSPNATASQLTNRKALEAYPTDFQLIDLHAWDATSRTKAGAVREDGKRPLHSNWTKRDYGPSRDVLARCLKAGRNVGVRLKDDQLVIDVDPRNGGEEGFRNLCDDFLLDLSKCPCVRTGSGGWHYYMSKPADVRVCDTLAHESDTETNKRYAGVEFKSVGRQVVAAGSCHPNGKLYRWAEGHPSIAAGLPPIDDALLEAIARPERICDVPGGFVEPERIATVLEPLNAEDFADNDSWFKLMCAVHHATGGDARQEWIDWSTSDPEFADHADIIGRRWDSLDKARPDAITVGTLNHILRAKGLNDLQIGRGDAADDFEQADAEDDRLRAAKAEIFGDEAVKDDEPNKEDLEWQQETDARNKRAREAEARLRSEYKEQRYSLPEICDQWVWIGPLKKFVNRETPTLAFDKEGFNDRFQYLKGDSPTLTKKLFSRTKDTIRKINGVVYRPNAAEFTADGMWNGWRPSPVAPVEGDTTLLEEHAAYLFPEAKERNLLLDWIAAVLQNPQTKPRHQVMLIGPHQGTGKTFFPRLIRELLGTSNCQALTQDILLNGFTGWAMRTKFVWVEEIRDVANSKAATAKLHTWASEGTITVNEKNLPTFVMDQAIAFMLMSNKRDAVAPDNTDRRYLTFATEAKPKSGDYYDKLYGVNGVGGVLHTPALLSAAQHFFLSRKLQDGYSIERAAPFTAAKQELIDASGSEWQKWLLDNPPSCEVVCITDIIEAMPRYLQRAGVDNGVRNTLRDRFGGVPWPHQIQPDGRTGGKVRVWLLGETAKQAAKLTSGEVRARYMAERQWALQDEEEFEFG